MTAVAFLLGSIAFIALSIVFHFAPRTRVLAGLCVGTLIGGVAVSWIHKAVAKAAVAVSKPLARLLGQGQEAVALALPGVLAFILAVILFQFLRGHHGHTTQPAGRAGTGGRRTASAGGGHGRSGRFAHVALAAAIVLPSLVSAFGAIEGAF